MEIYKRGPKEYLKPTPVTPEQIKERSKYLLEWYNKGYRYVLPDTNGTIEVSYNIGKRDEYFGFYVRNTEGYLTFFEYGDEEIYSLFPDVRWHMKNKYLDIEDELKAQGLI